MSAAGPSQGANSNPVGGSAAARPQASGGPPHAIELTLLVRAYCHLCDDMRAALMPLAQRAGAAIVEIDIDAHPRLEAQFGDRVPVLLQGGVGGRELCHFTLDVQRVAQALAGRLRGQSCKSPARFRR